MKLVALIKKLLGYVQKNEEMNKWLTLGLFVVLFCYLIAKSVDYPLHDYSNSYFPALLLKENIAPETVVYDIIDFNEYAWNKGHEEVFIDFYLNSPFTSTFFYPFTFLDAYSSKLSFNLFSILLFVASLYLVLKKYPKIGAWALLFPLIFYVPLRNNILFGQTYLLTFFLIVAGVWLINKKHNFHGISLINLGVLIKIFPIYYFPIFLFKKERKSIIFGIISGTILISISIYLSPSFWYTYFFEVIPNAIANESTIDFSYQAQSITVLLKRIFVYDPYYNAEAILDSYFAYKVIEVLIKGLIIGVSIQVSFLHRKDLFRLLAIWIVAGFLLQSRTATYAQILWFIPCVIYLSSATKSFSKLFFLVILTLVCNFPVGVLPFSSLFILFSKLWFSLILAILFYKELMGESFHYKYLGLGILLMAIPSFFSIGEKLDDSSVYVLTTREYFIIDDIMESHGKLNYKAIDRNGVELIETDIKINSFDTTSCKIIDNQIFIDNIQITFDPSLKKKPVLIDDCQIYYLTDRNSRRGAFTLKKINICNDK